MPNIILQDCNGCTNNYSKLYLLLLQLLSTSMFSAQGAGHQQTERRVWTWDNPTLFHDWPDSAQAHSTLHKRTTTWQQPCVNGMKRESRMARMLTRAPQGCISCNPRSRSREFLLVDWPLFLILASLMHGAKPLTALWFVTFGSASGWTRDGCNGS
jgi:hypothetical protein